MANNNAQAQESMLKEIQNFDFDSQMTAAQRGLNLQESFTDFTNPEMAARLEGRGGSGAGNGATLLVGDILFFDSTKVKVGIVDIGTNGATVMLVPFGYLGDDKKPVIKGIKQVYLSSFTKTIRVTDSMGDPVLGADGNVVIRDGHGNTIWETMTGLTNEKQRFEFLKDKALKVVKIIRDFGPSGYVEIGGSRIPKAHRLTTLYLFEEVMLG